MFNRMSRERLRLLLQHKFPHLIPLMASLYCHHNKVYFKHTDGTLNLIKQIEGFAQGCPLSA
eukprot:3425944-Ditylum_brightwellii.AAC.1